MFTQPSWRPIGWEDIFSVNEQGPARRAGLRGCLLGAAPSAAVEPWTIYKPAVSHFGVMRVYDNPVIARKAGNDGVSCF